MKWGKKIGIAAMVLVVIYIIFSIIFITQMPELPDEFYELLLKDQEAAIDMENDILENASPLFKITNGGKTIVGIIAIIASIVSLVLMIKNKEKGKFIPICAMILIIVFFFVSTFSIVDFGNIMSYVVEME